MLYRSLIILTLLLSVESAYAFCSAPSEPSSYEKPSKPDEYATQNYEEELETYETEKEEYIQKLREYASDADDYVSCEINELE